MRSILEKYFNHLWYSSSWQYRLWAPLESFYIKAITEKRKVFREAEKTARSVPILIVGNITVGGTGKTPVVIYLVEELKKAGLRVGVISRGYGGNSERYPYLVDADSDVSEAGDEPLLIVKRTGAPLVVDPNRIEAYNFLVNTHDLDVVISDDGLQHYTLPRDIELVVLDASRAVGNGRCLPAGPLREPLDRLTGVDFLLSNGVPGDALKKLKLPAKLALEAFTLEPQLLHQAGDDTHSIPLNGLQREVFGVAAIGNPKRFFNTLSQLGYQVEPVEFPDHYAYSQKDFEKLKGKPIITTEKDAVKMQGIQVESLWVLRVALKTNPQLIDDILSRIQTYKTSI